MAKTIKVSAAALLQHFHTQLGHIVDATTNAHTPANIALAKDAMVKAKVSGTIRAELISDWTPSRENKKGGSVFLNVNGAEHRVFVEKAELVDGAEEVLVQVAKRGQWSDDIDQPAGTSFWLYQEDSVSFKSKARKADLDRELLKRKVKLVDAEIGLLQAKAKAAEKAAMLD